MVVDNLPSPVGVGLIGQQNIPVPASLNYKRKFSKKLTVFTASAITGLITILGFSWRTTLFSGGEGDHPEKLPIQISVPVETALHESVYGRIRVTWGNRIIQVTTTYKRKFSKKTNSVHSFGNNRTDNNFRVFLTYHVIFGWRRGPPWKIAYYCNNKGWFQRVLLLT